MEIEKKIALKQQSSKFFRETMGTSNSYETRIFLILLDLTIKFINKKQINLLLFCS